MTARATHRRPGLTLTEVLVAMFVMALGLISLLTLFPLGAIQIGFALRDDRCAQTAAQADAFLRAVWQANVVEAPEGLPKESFFCAMDDPNLVMQRTTRAFATANPATPSSEKQTSSLPASSGTPLLVNQYIGVAHYSNGSEIPRNPATKRAISATTLANDLYEGPISGTEEAKMDTFFGNWPAYFVVPNSTEVISNAPNERTAAVAPSYPVFIDPLNYNAKIGTGDRVWVGWTAAGGAAARPLTVARRTLTQFINAPSTATNDAIKTFGLNDDLTFAKNGVPQQTGSAISRQGTYNWSAVVQRATNGQHRDKANLTILVYDGRPAGLTQAGDEVVGTPDIRVGEPSVTVTLKDPADPNAPPAVRRGGWFMDGTVSQGPNFTRVRQSAAPAPGTEGTDFVKVRQANWYRITGLTSVAGDGTNGTPVGSTRYTLDIDPPIRPLASGFGAISSFVDAPTVGIQYTATLYFLTGLAEVFVRPPLAPIKPTGR